MSYKDLITRDIRFLILRALNEDPGYSHNEAILQQLLSEFGHHIGRDRLRTELKWLEEMGTLHIIDSASFWVVSLTRTGCDVATGAMTIPGIARPRPVD